MTARCNLVFAQQDLWKNNTVPILTGFMTPEYRGPTWLEAIMYSSGAMNGVCTARRMQARGGHLVLPSV
eukprot:scaffold129965_cov18-Tisochrysis_lutea.AAC.1